MPRTALRSPELAFVLFGRPFVWKCSLCNRLFVGRYSASPQEDAEELQREFRIHLCWPLSDSQMEKLLELDVRSSWFNCGDLKR